MSFLPPPTSTLTKNDPKHGLLSLAESVLTKSSPPSAYNKHEPLVAQSETNIDNEETIRLGVGVHVESETKQHQQQRNSIYSRGAETSEQSESRLKFTNHLDQCNSSLAKLVNMMNRKC